MAEQKVTTMLEVPVRDLLAIAPFRAEMDVRYYLNGVFVEPIEGGGCLLVATDGHMLAAMRSKESRADKPRILNIDNRFERALREHGGLGEEKTIKVADEKSRAVVSSKIREYYIQPDKPFIDGKFPDWRKVLFPLDILKRGNPSTIASKYLATLQRALPKELRDRCSGVSFWYNDRETDGSAVVCRYDSFPELIVMIMPVREGPMAKWPDWYPTKSAETAVAEAS